MNLIRRILKKLIYLFVSNDRLFLSFLGASIQLRAENIIDILLKQRSKDDLNKLLASHEKEVLEAMNPEVVIGHLLLSHRLKLIEAINCSGDGDFKYVGHGVIKIMIGAGMQELPGWFATDISLLNVVEKSAWSRLFTPNTIDNILAEHVLEHLSLEELTEALSNIREYLKPGGKFRFAVPDAFHPSKYYYNLVKPAGWETPFEHKIFFDYEMICRIAKDAGFQIELIEYFDENGVFHNQKYLHDDGIIRRCASNNLGLDVENPEIMEQFYASIPDHLRQQFYDRKMSYTSLIVDLIK